MNRLRFASARQKRSRNTTADEATNNYNHLSLYLHKQTHAHMSMPH